MKYENWHIKDVTLSQVKLELIKMMFNKSNIMLLQWTQFPPFASILHMARQGDFAKTTSIQRKKKENKKHIENNEEKLK